MRTSCLDILYCELPSEIFNPAFLSDAASVSQSSDGSVPEDLLAKLHDFPLVPSKTLSFPNPLSSAIYEGEDRIPGKGDLSISSLTVDSPSEKLLGSLPLEEEKDATSAFLRASQILRKYVFLHSQVLWS
jgi:hypothetical protein